MRIEPSAGATRPTIAFATVDLPLPLSPTMPVEWPTPTSKVMPFTAWTSSPRVL